MKIAQYKLGADPYVSISEVDDWKERPDTNWVRLTEILEVEFQPLPAEVTIHRELAQLEAMEKELTAEHLKKLNAIQTRRKDLLSLAPPSLVSEVA